MQAILVAHDPEEREILAFVLRHGGLAVANAPALERVAARWMQRPADLIVVAWDGSTRPYWTILRPCGPLHRFRCSWSATRWGKRRRATSFRQGLISC